MTFTSGTIGQKLLLATLLSVLTLPTCLAQSGPDLSEASLEQLSNIKVYSASKHLQETKDAPSSVTVITADDIQRHGYRTLADVLQSVRGFFATYDRNYTNMGVRGFARPGDFDTRVLLLVDGHRLNDNVYDQAMLGTDFPIDIALVQRIEVIRGPVSSLYGSNALFAVINIITRRGRNLEGLELSSGAGSFNTYAGRLSYGRELQGLEFLVSGSFYGSRGQNRLFFPEYNSPDTNNGIASHADDDQLGSALTSISYRDFSFQAVYGTREKGIPTAAYDTIFNHRGTRTVDSHFYLDLRYEHKFRNVTEILARTFYDRYTYSGIYMYPSPDNAAQISPNLDFADGKWWGVELQATRTMFKRNRITLGGEYRNNLRQNQSNFFLNPYSLVLDDRRSSFVGAMYVQDELTIAKPLTLNAGLRYDYYSRVESSATPRIAMIYRPFKQTALKFIYGESFRVPNVYELYYSILPNLPNPALRPERIRTTEFIWEQGLVGQLWFSTSVFHNSIERLITQEAAGPNLLMFGNLPALKSTGWEIEVKDQFAWGLEGMASYSFQQTQDPIAHAPLSNSPEHLVKLNLTRSFWQRRMFASLNAQYRSRMNLPTAGWVPANTVVNATLLSRRIGERLDLSASIYNLFNTGHSDPSSGVTLQRTIKQDGRGCRVTMTWHFGER